MQSERSFLQRLVVVIPVLLALASVASAAVPTFISLTPASAVAGGAGFTLTIQGNYLNSTSMVRWGSTALAVGNVSAVSLTVAVPARLIASAGTATVTVSNAGRTANSANFTISPQPLTKSTQIASVRYLSGAAFGGVVTTDRSLASSSGQFTNAGTASGAVFGATASSNPPPTISSLITSSGSASGTALGAVTSVTLPPTISSLSPSATIAGGSAFTLTINGANFTSTSTASWSGAALTTSYISATQLTASVPASLISAAGTASVTVTNAGGTSTGTSFTVNPSPPTISSLAPNSIMAGAQNFTLTINGTNFLPGNLGSVVRWNYTSLTTTYVSSTQLTAIVLAPQLVSACTANISVVTAGGSSPAATFTVNPLPPIITSLSPTQIPAGSGAFNLSVIGANLTATPTITFGTTPLAFTRMTAGWYSVVVPASLVATAGKVNITVTTPGGISAPAVFTVTPPLPVITSISPASAPAGSASFTLTINGINLLPTSHIYLKSTILLTTCVSATQVTAVVPASMLASATTMSLALYTTGFGNADWSNSLFFTVNPAPPTITSLSPASATAGGAGFMLTIKGTAFTTAATSMWGTTPLDTIYVSPTQLTASIPASLIEFAGAASVTASTGAGASAPVTFTIKPAPPVIGGLSPNLATAGGAAFTLTIYGNFFTPASTSKWGSTALTTTYVSATQLTAAVPAKLIATAGTANVSVTTSLGTAPAAAFTIYPTPKIKTTSLPSGTINYDYSGPITVTGGVPGYTWAVNGLPSTMSYTNTSNNTMSITGTPVSSGTISFQVSVQDNAGNTAGPVTFNLQVAAGPSGANNASLNGSYTCLLQGSMDEDDSRWASVASFQADGQGNFTNGIFDTNSHDVGSASGILTGSYKIGADNNGQATLHTILTNNAAGIQTIKWAIALSGSAQHFRMVESDDLGELPSGQQATANCYAATPSSFAATTISGSSFAFALDGEDNNSNLKSTVGLFRASAESSASGYLDSVMGGSSTIQSTAFTTTYTAPDPASGRFTVALNGAGSSTGFTVYIIDANRMFILDNTSDDGEQAGEMRTQQQAAYSAANIQGPFVLYGRGAEFNGSGGTPSAFYATLSQGAGDGAGNITINQSYTNNAGSYSTGNTVGNPSALAFDSVHPGRATLPSASGITYLYLFNTNSAFEMTVKDNGSFDSGALEPQSPPSSQTTFTDASLAGSYLSGELPLFSPDANASVGVYNLSASGAITGATTLAGQNELAWDQTLSTSYAWDSTAPGTETFIIANGPQGEASCAVINTTKFVCASQTDPAPSLQLMQQ